MPVDAPHSTHCLIFVRRRVGISSRFTITIPTSMHQHSPLDSQALIAYILLPSHKERVSYCWSKDSIQVRLNAACESSCIRVAHLYLCRARDGPRWQAYRCWDPQGIMHHDYQALRLRVLAMEPAFLSQATCLGLRPAGVMVGGGDMRACANMCEGRFGTGFILTSFFHQTG